MIRQAQTQDIPQLAKLWYAEKPKTCFNELRVDWSEAACAVCLSQALASSDKLVLVDDESGIIQGAIGVSIYPHHLPPHPMVVTEWVWFHQGKRGAVKLLQAIRQISKDAGATLLHYTLNQPSQSGTKFTETYQWEVL